MRDSLRQAAVALAAFATIGVNGLANALPLNGQTTGAISDRFPVYFVPAGYVFSIWGLIYVGIIAFAIYQSLPSQRANPLLRRVGYSFVVSCAANVAWLFLWHYGQFVLTLVAMLLLLLSLIIIYREVQAQSCRISRLERWMVLVPFSIYLGWITVATIANVTVVLYYVGWDGWGIASPTWAAIMLVVGGAIASAVSLPRVDFAYMGVILWAFVGIAVKQSSTPLVALTALTAAAVLAALIIARWLMRGGHPGAGSRPAILEEK